MLYNFPSNFVFYTKVKDHEQLKKKLLPQIYANESGITYKGEYQDSITNYFEENNICLLYTSPSPRDKRQSRMPSSA